MIQFFVPICLLVMAVVAVAAWVALSRRPGLGPLLVAEVSRIRRRPQSADTIHLLLCIADHFEPHNGGVGDDRADARVEAWENEYPRLFADVRDSDGRTPKHTFFYPIEQYHEPHVTAVARLCAAGCGELEVHLHHDHDTEANLRRTLLHYKTLLHERHGLLSRHRRTGQIGYAFVHGNWALDNSRPDGRWCGVNNELDVLRETGCFADLTLPSAPSPTQTRQINSIYYAVDDPRRPKSHDRGIPVGSGSAPPNGFMLIQGPLVLDWQRRKWGLLPRIENACIQYNQPPAERRIDLWLRARVQVPLRPDWFFVKLHTHGAPETNRRVLLGEPMLALHRALRRRADENRQFHFHYVTAREMYNLARAAEAGWEGTVSDARDFEYVHGLSTHPNRAPQAVIEQSL